MLIDIQNFYVDAVREPQNSIKKKSSKRPMSAQPKKFSKVIKNMYKDAS